MTNLILYYLLLLTATFFIFKNALHIWKKKNDFTFPLITLIIFYFTLGGAYIFPLDWFSGFKGASIGLHYVPIFDRLFPVNFDRDYMLACSYYLVFILVFQYAYIFLVNKISNRNILNSNRASEYPFVLKISPVLVFVVSVALISASIFFLRKEIIYAIAHEKSIYKITRATTSKYYSLHQIANEFCVIIPFIAYTFTVLKPGALKVFSDYKKGALVLIFTACFLSALYISLIGNRREVLSGIIICTLFSVNHLKHIRYKRLIPIFLLAMSLFFMNDFFRSTVIPKKLNEILKLEAVDIELKEEVFDAKGLASSVFFSNELFYAHFSMYGALHKNIPITHGSSFIYLASAVIPKALNPNRPPDIYNYYATSVHAVPGQNYTIHHATGWYLNFGFAGVVAGAIVLAFLLAFAFYVTSHSFRKYNRPLIWLRYLLPALICSQMVTMISAGPEGYKGMLIEGVIIPILLLSVCSQNKKITS